jgi:hypothetical protein
MPQWSFEGQASTTNKQNKTKQNKKVNKFDCLHPIAYIVFKHEYKTCYD